jgi:hypothetical protein
LCEGSKILLEVGSSVGVGVFVEVIGVAVEVIGVVVEVIGVVVEVIGVAVEVIGVVVEVFESAGGVIVIELEVLLITDIK